jgi:hypothetical protein
MDRLSAPSKVAGVCENKPLLGQKRGCCSFGFEDLVLRVQTR